MGRLSTHVLDIQSGRPAAGVGIELLRIEADGSACSLKKVATNSDGRTDAPLLEGSEFGIGVFELRFTVGAYFDTGNTAGAEPRFLDVVPIRFGISELGGHYHVPLLVSPWAYSTYRGS